MLAVAVQNGFIFLTDLRPYTSFSVNVIENIVVNLNRHIFQIFLFKVVEIFKNFIGLLKGMFSSIFMNFSLN